MYLNKAILVGNLTRDPEKRALPSGQAVTNFSIATNRTWKDANGAMQEATDYHNIVIFGRQAETSAQYLKKGQSVMIEGRIQTRSWDGEDGKKNYRTEINADRIQFGPKAGNGSAGAPNQSDQGAQDQSSPAESAIEYPEADINPEDIPF